MEWIKSLSGHYGVLITMIAIILFIWGIYNKIKFLCLEKAAQMVAEAESHSDLSGAEKFALCLLWINKGLPKLFKNTLFQSIIEKLIQFAYDSAFKYMKEHVKNTTGYDITELVEQIKEEETSKE